MLPAWGTQLPHVAGVAERVAPGLGPHGESVGLRTDLDLGDVAGRGVDRVDDVVVATAEPQRLAVVAHVAHVGAAPAGDRPGGDDLAGGEVEHRHAAGAVRRTTDVAAATVGDVELGAVSARVEAVRPDAGLD